MKMYLVTVRFEVDEEEYAHEPEGAEGAPFIQELVQAMWEGETDLPAWEGVSVSCVCYADKKGEIE